jgi:hypothetical protein
VSAGAAAGGSFIDNSTQGVAMRWFATFLLVLAASLSSLAAAADFSPIPAFARMTEATKAAVRSSAFPVLDRIRHSVPDASGNRGPAPPCE